MMIDDSLEMELPFKYQHFLTNDGKLQQPFISVSPSSIRNSNKGPPKYPWRIF